MKDILWTDLETYSEVNLKTCGSYKYAEKCEILLLGYAYDDDPVTVVDMTEVYLPSAPLINDYNEKLKKCKYIGAHNGILFDRVVMNNNFYFKNKIAGKSWFDTAAKAYAHSLPGGLDLLCDLFKLPVDKAKMKEGLKYMHLFCKPQGVNSKIKRATRFTHPEQWKKFIEYSKQDIIAMREVNKLIPDWNITAQEKEYQDLDMEMNDRGFFVDTELALEAINILALEKISRDKEVMTLTQGDVAAATQRDKLLQHIAGSYDIYLPDLQHSTLERILDDPYLPEPVRELISLRLQSTKMSTKKYKRILDVVCKDSRLHGTMVFHGAWRTGRQSGRLFQPHNLPRPLFSTGEIQTGIDAIKTGCIILLYLSITAICSSALRGTIIAPPGKKLVVADLSSVESRGLAWLAGETWKLKAYQDYDAGIGYDLYVLIYSLMFGIPPETVTGDQRKLGKVVELALGYGGGVVAFIAFANAYGINLDDIVEGAHDLDQELLVEAENFYNYSVEIGKTYNLPQQTFIVCDTIKRMWRKKNSNIVRFWKSLEQSVKDILFNNNATRICGCLHIDKRGSWLRIRLPSGRYLCYPAIAYDNNRITYVGYNNYSRKICRLKMYGGKLAENVNQAFCYDLFFYGVKRARDNGYLPVLTVHDESVTEVSDTPVHTAEELCTLLSEPPDWAPGFPGAAAGFETYRYRKD